MDLHLLLPLTLVPAILIGHLLRRVGVPIVVGQILAGIVLGSSVLGLLPEVPHGGEESARSGLYELAEIGLCVLLFRIGLETKFQHFAAIWRPAIRVALLGMVLPLVFGTGAALALGWGLKAALFVGAALTATSIGVTASVIEEMQAQETPEAALIMGAAVADDILGLVLLSTLAAFVIPEGSVGMAVAKSLSQAVGFLGIAILLGPAIASGLVRLSEWLRSKAILIVAAFCYLLMMAYLAEKAGLAGIIGSYAAGLAFAQHHDEDKLLKQFEPLTDVLSPIFFVLIGSSIAFSSIDSTLWLALGLILVAAVAGKMIAAYALPKKDYQRAAVGTGLMPRGEVGLVFAQLGLTSRALQSSHYTVLTLALVVTTIVGPLWFRSALRSPRE